MNEKSDAEQRKIADSTIRRLSMYLRTLDILQQAGVETISSQKFAEIEGVTSVQIRKDFSFFGSFGRKGLGYEVSGLKKNLAKILGVDQKWNVVLIGAGHFSAVMMHSEAFKMRNFTIGKIFDQSPDLVGKKIDNITIKNIKDLEKNIDPKDDHLAIIALPPRDVQAVVNRLGRIGVKGVLYFASRTIDIPGNMVIRNQDMSVELGTLTYYITNKTKHLIKK